MCNKRTYANKPSVKYRKQPKRKEHSYYEDDESGN